jgi:hypothetical protein
MSKLLNLQNGLTDIESGTYLILINPERIPHLVYLHDGRYYSLTYKGVELAFSFLPYLDRLIRTKKKMIFIELDVELLNAFEVFSSYKNAGDDQKTCLNPVKELILPESKAEMVFQLIPELYKNGLIKSVSHIGLEDMLDEKGDFELTEYAKEDIINYIQLLKNRYVEG